MQEDASGPQKKPNKSSKLEPSKSNWRPQEEKLEQPSKHNSLLSRTLTPPPRPPSRPRTSLPRPPSRPKTAPPPNALWPGLHPALEVRGLRQPRTQIPKLGSLSPDPAALRITPHPEDVAVVEEGRGRQASQGGIIRRHRTSSAGRPNPASSSSNNNAKEKVSPIIILVVIRMYRAPLVVTLPRKCLPPQVPVMDLTR